MGYEDSIGVFTKGQIKDFYRNVLGMGKLQPKKIDSYDDICDFLVDLFKIGANPITYDADSNGISNPIDDILNKSEEDYGYTKEERMEVQNNLDLRKNQERQFKEYSGNDDLITEEMYDLISNRIFYWKNQDYSSHVLHPFMYNLKLWNKLNNIIVNGYKDYVNSDLIDILSSKVKFDEVFGKYGEAMNFWKYNIQDWSGYTTRYEEAIKDEHLDDANNTTSPLTGYDGLFYPKAAEEFLDIYEQCLDSSGSELLEQFELPRELFSEELTIGEFDDRKTIERKREYLEKHPFIDLVNSIYWQVDAKYEGNSYYVRWYSHLNYTRTEYQKIAIQLWYWRKRIVELISKEYPIMKYCLDTMGNSMVLVSTFGKDECQGNPYLVDLTIWQNKIENPTAKGLYDDRWGNQNDNIYVPSCDNKLKLPSELWIRWKSNPLALPSFDIHYDLKTGDGMFDLNYRTKTNVEMGQLTHTNNDSNDNFKVVIGEWRKQYGNVIGGNRLPVFFDMEQSANILALASWNTMTSPDLTDDEGENLILVNCGKNPYHIVSVERNGSFITDYNLTEYGNNDEINQCALNGELIPSGMKWLFDSYHYCPSNGSLLIPFYAFECIDYIVDSTSGGTCEITEPNELHQTLKTRMLVIPAQEMKNGNYVTSGRLEELKHVDIDLNGKFTIEAKSPDDEDDKSAFFRNYAFGHPAKACKNTNVVFSPYDSKDGNKIRCAFLGCFVNEHGEDAFQSYKVSSCDAKTRYELDSQTEEDLSLLKNKYYEANGENWTYADSTMSEWNKWNSSVKQRKYIDETIAKHGFNSYDSLDKYVFVVDFEPSIDNKTLFDLAVENGISTCSYNILGDAGYIPHFAYQSLVKYDDDDGGIAYTWKNKYLNNKNHMQFELLGLDDKNIPKMAKAMENMIVHDDTDKCETLISPAKMMDGIFRVWNDVKGVKPRNAKVDGVYVHFTNEYKDYVIPQVDFGDCETVELNPCPKDDLFELDLPSDFDST